MNTYSDNYRFKYLDIKNGLSNNFIMSIAQDKKGFIWIATESGLNRFDGKKFKNYEKSRTNSLNSISGNALNRLYYDKKDDILWIATQREGLNAFDCATEQFIHYRHSENRESIISNDITHITKSSNGGLWISSYYSGIDYFDKKTNSFSHYNTTTIPNLISNMTWVVEEDSINRTLLIGHVNNGLSVMSLKDKTVKNFKHNPKDKYSIPNNTVHSICIDSNNNIWIGTENGLAFFDSTNGLFHTFKHNKKNQNSISSNFIYSIKEIKNKKLIISTQSGGVNILDLKRNQLTTPENFVFNKINNENFGKGINHLSIKDVYQDSFDNIWIGTYGEGINVMYPSILPFNTWEYSPINEKKDRLNHKVAWGICSDSKDNLWIGTDGGGINVFNNGSVEKTYTKENSTLVDNFILAAIKDSRDNLWFGTFNNGVSVFNIETKNFSTISFNDSTKKDVRCFYESPKEQIYIGTNYGFYIYDQRTKKITNYNSDNSAISENFVRSIAEDSFENLWIGTFGSGLFILDKQLNLVQHFDTYNGFLSNTINHIFKDSKNQMWIATGEGLVFFPKEDKSSTYNIISENEGLINSHIRAITEDNENNIWISTNKGISQITPEKTIYNYNDITGIPLGNFMSGSVTKTSDGSIYFGSQNGVCFFHPKKIQINIPMSPVTITDIIVYSSKKDANRPINTFPVNGKINLPYNNNTFSVSFNNLNIAQNSMTEYAYLLNDINDVWISTGSENYVTFRNLPHGKYTLNIKSRLANQDWDENWASLRIVIHPPLWLTWWAKTLYILLILSIILLILWFYKRKLEVESTLMLEKKNHIQEQELNNERLRFFTNITHELRTPLTLILGPLDDLFNDKELTEKQRKRISKIKSSGNRLYELINQILEFRKTETENRKLKVSKEDILSLIGEVGLKYKELNINKSLEINTIIESNDTILFFDEEVITMVLDNLISNSIKHTPKGSIQIIVRDVVKETLNYLEIEVKDTGKGIPEEYQDKIFNRYFQVETDKNIAGTGIGLSLVKNLIELHQAQISFTSSPNQGSSFFILLNKNNTYPSAIHKIEIQSNNKEESQNEAFTNQENVSLQQTILVVEDNEDIRKYIKESLSDYYTILTTDNGEKGYELAIEHTPDLIISDIMMPIMDGIELCDKIKKDVRTSHIPVILLTAKDRIEDRAKGYEVGADSYIIKPFNTRLLHSRISNLFENRKKTAELIKNNTSIKNEIINESINKLDKEFLEKLETVVLENIESENLAVATIAKKMNMSHSTLYRKVKSLTDMSVNEYTRKLKMQKAEQLLLEGKYNISEISYMVGINSITYFRQCFKDQYGLPPSDYVKYILENNKKKND